MFSRIAIAFAVLAPLSGCAIFSVEAEIPEMCMTFHDRMIAGVPAGEEFARSITVDPLEFFGPWVELDAEITQARATLVARRGVSDLSFLESLTVVMRGTTQDALPLVNCVDYACASDDMVSTLADTTPDGIMNIVREGDISLDLVMTGDLPESEWVVDVQVCVSGRAKAALSL
jgi:hypothetical protein